MKKSGLKALMMAAAMAIASVMPASAADPGAVLSTDTKDGQIVMYVQNPGTVESMDFQIGTGLCGQVESSPVSDQEIPLKTMILLDNSLSVTEKYRPLISQMIQDIVADRMDREQFTIATFSESIQYLIQDSNDYAQIKQIVDGISYQDQETYLTDVLYDLLKELDQAEDDCFKRIIIISDGVDNKTIGYTKEELYDLIGKKPYPIYTLGCTYKDNSGQLKNMFALSRMSNGRSYLLDEVEDPITVVTDLAGDRDILKITARPDADQCDGSVKTVQITFHTSEGDVASMAEVRMPMVQAGAAAEPETEEQETEPETDAEPVPETEEEEEDEPEDGNIPFAVLAAGLGIVLIFMAGITVLVVVVVKKKNKRETFEPFNGNPPVNEPGPSDRRQETEWLEQNRGGQRNDSTQMLWDDKRKYVLCLADQKNLARTFECPLAQSVVIGRKPEACQMVLDYDKSVSGRHCEIFIKNGKFYIRDLNSSNGTFVNGSRVLTDAEVYSGCILTLGRLTLKLEIH
ncbi:FHA domain-containing protein [Clostridium sp. MCC353]|uniref:FHA domain-containing protein n=1 Tax=Clostridium sp. MCC353 TaxID=2592646 RepID=UPI001C034089|nr:FHA domain-containing protein [Clostridium sp. MCC353]MBT9778507.1 FHA domain-containing protein [Clostridium sp. MCC353]